MTTSTMQQLKHDGDFSDELNETSTIQFYNKVSQQRKRRKTRTTFSNCQLNELENNFNRQRYLTPTDRDRIAKHLGLTNTQVITWFQNRRAKLKREAEELERDISYNKV
ncbi:putative homeobox protein [Schistosoma mansoni]|uniref:putative homeobox protein n=1 Tax=Schistosoma mansoni TaxID=6183 RepID=UPI0001A625CA|nr:putative homeobox protein [Schistosoma mansoni]|eukprot:XP_018650702.1 putative homeobox protein [Schistosoma mansoni]